QCKRGIQREEHSRDGEPGHVFLGGDEAVDPVRIRVDLVRPEDAATVVAPQRRIDLEHATEPQGPFDRVFPRTEMAQGGRRAVLAHRLAEISVEWEAAAD